MKDFTEHIRCIHFLAPEYHLSLRKSSINMFLKTITKAIEKPTNKLIE